MQREKCDLFELSIHRINYIYIYIWGLLWLKKNPQYTKNLGGTAEVYHGDHVLSFPKRAPNVYNKTSIWFIQACRPFSSVSVGPNGVICFVLIKQVFFLGWIVRQQIAFWSHHTWKSPAWVVALCCIAADPVGLRWATHAGSVFTAKQNMSLYLPPLSPPPSRNHSDRQEKGEALQWPAALQDSQAPCVPRCWSSEFLFITVPPQSGVKGCQNKGRGLITWSRNKSWPLFCWTMLLEGAFTERQQ